MTDKYHCSYCDKEFLDHTQYVKHVPCEGMMENQRFINGGHLPENAMSDKKIKITQPDIHTVSVYAAPPIDDSSFGGENGSTGVLNLSTDKHNRVKITRTHKLQNQQVTTQVVLESGEISFQELKEQALEIMDKYESEQ